MLMEGWFFITASLLLVTGGAKLVDPEPTRGALRAARLPSTRVVVRALATIEVIVGMTALVEGGLLGGVGVAALYTCFAGFVIYALARQLPIQSCGCLGRTDTPPSKIHAAVNLAAAASGVVMAAQQRPGLIEVLPLQPAAGLPYLAFIAIGSFLLALVISELPKANR
jgi:presenilin-like A22 family membrane protease